MKELKKAQKKDSVEFERINYTVFHEKNGNYSLSGTYSDQGGFNHYYEGGKTETEGNILF